MSCCGENVDHRPVPGGAFFKAAHSSQPQKRLKAGFLFRYEGLTTLTVHGPYSGRRYRFTKTNAVVMTDPRDYHALITVPGLEVLVQDRSGNRVVQGTGS